MLKECPSDPLLAEDHYPHFLIRLFGSRTLITSTNCGIDYVDNGLCVIWICSVVFVGQTIQPLLCLLEGRYAAVKYNDYTFNRR